MSHRPAPNVAVYSQSIILIGTHPKHNPFYGSRLRTIMVDILRKEVPYGFDETVKRVEEAMLSEGFGVQLTTGIHEMFKKKLGIDNYPKYTFILGCTPHLAKRALETSLDMGLIFPCSFTVYEEDGKVKVAHVSIMKIGAEIGLADKEAMAPLIEDTGKVVGRVWDKI